MKITALTAIMDMTHARMARHRESQLERLHVRELRRDLKKRIAAKLRNETKP